MGYGSERRQKIRLLALESRCVIAKESAGWSQEGVVGHFGVGELTRRSSHMLRQLQSDQYAHDQRNHFDILCLHKAERLKHYGLHFAKYIGRFARGAAEPKPFERTITDTFLINLSTANTLAQDLSMETFAVHQHSSNWNMFFIAFADAAGRFADACEKLDHLEEGVGIAKTANCDITNWILHAAEDYKLDLEKLIADRRKELAARVFYITG